MTAKEIESLVKWIKYEADVEEAEAFFHGLMNQGAITAEDLAWAAKAIRGQEQAP